MGNLLGSPITDKITCRGETTSGLGYGISSMQGWRIHMEDAHICQPELYAEYEEEADALREVKLNGNSHNTPDGIVNAAEDRQRHDAKETGNNSPTKKLKRTVRIPVKDTSLFAVFDGHGGTLAAEFSANNLVRVLSRRPKFVEFAKMMKDKKDVLETADKGESGNNMTAKQEEEQYSREKACLGLLEDALCEAFVEVDKELLHYIFSGPSNNDPSAIGETDEERENRERDESGTTAIVVVLTPDWIVCANAGDSRAVYSKSRGKATALSYDHKPDDEAEETRITNAGGYVSGGRVDGDLAVSRGFGDFRFKACPHLDPEDQKVSPIPDIIVQNRNNDTDEFIVLACDGIWDVVTNEDCVKMIIEIFDEGETDIGTACEEVLDLCLRKGSKDNMTSLIIKLPALKTGKGGGVAARRQKLADNQEKDKDEMDVELHGEQIE